MAAVLRPIDTEPRGRRPIMKLREREGTDKENVYVDLHATSRVWLTGQAGK